MTKRLGYNNSNGNNNNVINNVISVTSGGECILAILLGSSKNDRLEMTLFSVPTTYGTVTLRYALCNKLKLTAPGSLNTCPMCCPDYMGLLCLRSDPKKHSNLEVKSLAKAFCQFGLAEFRFSNSMALVFLYDTCHNHLKMGQACIVF